MRRHSAPTDLRQLQTCAVLALLVFMALVVVLSLTVRYAVALVAIYDTAQGETYVVDAGGNERRIQEDEVPVTLQKSQQVRTRADGSGRVEIIKDSRAFVYLLPDTEWQVERAERRGTLLEHARRQADEYELVIEQTQGTVVYDFSQADPGLADLNLILRFKDGEYHPQVPCFQATAPTTEAASAVVEVPCRTNLEVTPSQLPSLP